ncbi:uncharacterized protein EDB93DRAFT_1251330 [Suillus bovinus]|uniref:uncharacterized protein n=1 Tax=Suillus bovinus TaxID=48563 RepID=UPI001B86EEBC|nr:uncharacterized protein EDB93DRAFT_1251330 [Suillus bovinus]KAG2145459.1 hypothetical protein EDB93DRAFT_1251330 [Suillus bovinus]
MNVAYSHRSDDSDSEIAASQHHVSDPSISNPHPAAGTTSHCTSAHDGSHISTTLKDTQLQLQAIKQCNQLLEEKNAILEVNKPSRKASKAPSQLLVFDKEVKMFTKKYGIMYEMYPPSAELLKKTLPSTPDTLLSKLHSVLPDHLHHLVPLNHFHKTAPLEAGQSSKLIKLRRVAGRIFGLSSDYFVTSSKQDTIDELCRLLGTTPRSLNSTVFSNWKPLAQILKAFLMGEASLMSVKKGGPPRDFQNWGVSAIMPGAIAWSATIAIFLLSPDTVFSQDGHGKSSGIQYKNLFYSFKKILVCCWDAPYLMKIRQHIEGHVFGAAKLPIDAPDGEDFTAQIALAMAGLQSNDVDHDLDSTPVGDLAQGTDITQSALNSPLSTPRLSTQTMPSEILPSDGSSAPPMPLPAPAITNQIQNSLVTDGDTELDEGVTQTVDAEGHTQGWKKKKAVANQISRKSVHQKK